MESIGATLKQRRSDRGISLAEAHEATKITMQNLAALEEDRFDAFPNRVYSRAFLRDYANFLGLDSDDLLKRYETEWCGSLEAVAPRVRSRKPLKWLAGVGITVIILGGAGAGGYYLYSTQGRHKQVAVRNEEQPKPAPKPEVKPAPKPTAPTANGQPTTGAKPTVPGTQTPNPTATNPPANPTAEAVAPGMVKVTLTAVERPVWIQVWVDKDKSVIDTLDPKKGHTQATFVGKKIAVSAGDANALDVKVNGVSKGRFSPTRRFGVKKTFTAPPASKPATP